MNKASKILIAVGTLVCLSAIPLKKSPAASSPHPVIVGWLIGGSADGKWVKSDDMAEMIKGGEKYKIYDLFAPAGNATGSKVLPESEGPQCNLIDLSPKPAGADDRIPVALAADWDALPRKPKALPASSKVYQDAVRGILKSKGIANAPIEISQLLRVDLEGDGKDEVLINAASPNLRNSWAEPAERNVYSFIALRRIVAGKLSAEVLKGDFFPAGAGDDKAIEWSLVGTVDLNGDGSEEIIIKGDIPDGHNVTVFEIKNKKISPVIFEGCGW